MEEGSALEIPEFRGSCCPTLDGFRTVFWSSVRLEVIAVTMHYTTDLFVHVKNPRMPSWSVGCSQGHPS